MESEAPDTQVRAGATEPARTAKVAPAGEAAEHTYEVTITNLTDGQPLAPPLLVTHTKKADLFEAGQAAGVGIEGVAETGAPAGPNTSSYLANLQSNADIYAAEWVTGPGPIPPGVGNEKTYEITAAASANRLSAATMLVCTNDGFTGLDSFRLPHGQKATTIDVGSYDAGTEINTEAAADLVGGCPPGTHGKNLDAGPAEGGTISTPHPGVDTDTDGDDVLGSAFNWGSGPVARIEIERQVGN